MTKAMLEIQVIGELEVRLASAKAELPAGRRVRALLGWLAVHPGRHPRSRLAGQFWPDVLEASARASLRSAIWALRSALGPDLGSCLATDRDTVTLAADDLWVDLREVRRLIAQGQPAAALDLCRGDLLQELDDDWVVEAREVLDREVAAALRDLMHQAAAGGDWAAAAAWGRRRAALCPLDESAGADLIRALIKAGDGRPRWRRWRRCRTGWTASSASAFRPGRRRWSATLSARPRGRATQAITFAGGRRRPRTRSSPTRASSAGTRTSAGWCGRGRPRGTAAAERCCLKARAASARPGWSRSFRARRGGRRRIKP